MDIVCAIKMNKNYLIMLVGLVFAFTIVSAFGISSSYFEGNPLVLGPGESKDVSLALQNNIGDKDLSFTASVSDGDSGIAKIINKKDKYKVPFGTENTAIDLRVSIPNTALIGTEYSVSVNLNQVRDTEGGMLEVSGNIMKTFPVLVGEVVEAETGKNTLLIIVILISILAIILIIGYLIFRKKK